MDTFLFLLLIVALLVLLFRVWQTSRRARRADLIHQYRLPPGLFAKLQQKRPELSLKDCQLVGHALRQFFLAYLRSGFREVAMPSQVVDDLWHEFILYTREYQLFCRRAFGRFMHHTPAVVMNTKRESNDGLQRCWWFTCFDENIDPRKPTRLPLLFALDSKLNIADGFIYATDCRQLQNPEEYNADGRAIHCAVDLISRGVDGSTSGFGHSRKGYGCGGGPGCSSSGHGCSGSSGCSGGCGGH